LALTTRALLWRRGSTLTLLAVATVTTAAAALGPIYAQAAAESTLRDTLTQAPAEASGMAFHAQIDGSAKNAVGNLESTLPAPGSVLGYDQQIAEMTVKILPSATGGNGPVHSVLVYRQDACAHLVLVKGRCPSAAGEALVSDRAVAGGYGFALGGTMTVEGVGIDAMQPGTGASIVVPPTYTVVGVYRPVAPDDPFWFGRIHFDGHLFTGSGDGPDTIDDVFVAEPTFTALTSGSTVDTFVDYPLDPSQVRIADEETLRSSVSGLQGQYGPNDPVQMATDLPAVLGAADHERDLLDVSTVLVTLQLALLAWLVLYQVVADAAEVRGNEIALAKLRGLPPRSTLVFGLGEPFLVLLLAIPLGVLLGWVAVSLLAHAVLVPGTPVVLTWGALVGALAGFAGAAVGAALAARRVLTRPVLEQWRRVPQSSQPGRASLILDLVVVALAIAGLVALRAASTGSTGTQPRPLSLLGPGLLVLAVALLGVRLLPVAGRAALAPTRQSARVGAFLAVRQVVRRPSGLRLAALLAVAIGLATFAIDGEAVAASNRSTRAALEVGAAQVVHAQYQVDHDPIDVVRSVDPDGRWAMAAATWITNGGPVTGRLLAVDASRLAAVGNWPEGGSLTVEQAAALVGPAVPEPLVVTADSMRVTIRALAPATGAPPNVSLLVKRPSHKPELVRLGPLQPGTAQYAAAVPCAGGCTLQSIVLDRPVSFFDTMAGSVLVTAVERHSGGTWAPFDARLTKAGEWRGAGTPQTATDTVSATPEGLRDDYSSTGGASNGLGHVDSPVPLPLVSTEAGVRHDANAGPPVMVDKSASTTTFDEVGQADLLPQVLDNGALVDVRYVRTQVADFSNEADWQVWLSPSAPSDAVAQLTKAGLLAGTVDTQAERTAALARQGTALALLLLVACAVVGAVLAAGATALAVAVTGRRRSFELAALSAVGVPRRSLLRSCTGEQLILLGTGFLLGVPTGILAARIALPVIPLYSDTTPVPPSYEPHVWVLATFAAVVAALLVVVAVVAGRALMRSAVPTRLREAEQ
jgi:hypothetical protein